MAPPASGRTGGGAFSDTRWSVVLTAGSLDNADAHSALSWLCERYWFPLFATLRGRGHPPHDAEDLVQMFFAWLLAKNMVGRAMAEKGRFRCFLLGCLKNFLAHEWEKSHRGKRGGGFQHVPFDQLAAEERLQRELVELRTPALDFDRAWALALLDRAIAALSAECESDGHSGRFEVLQGFLHGQRGEMPLAEAAARLSVSVPAVKSVVHRLRLRFRQLLTAEVRETVSSDEEVRPELQRLLAALG